MTNQHLDGGGQRRRSPEAPEQSPGQLDSRRLVTMRDHSPFELLGHVGLSEIVAQGGEHEDLIPEAVIAAQLRRGGYRQQGVRPDVTIRMPLGILRHVHQSPELRKEPQQVGLLQELKPRGRTLAEH